MCWESERRRERRGERERGSIIYVLERESEREGEERKREST